MWITKICVCLCIKLLGDEFMRTWGNRAFNSVIITHSFPVTDNFLRIEIAITLRTFFDYCEYDIMKFAAQGFLFLRTSCIKFHAIKSFSNIHITFFFLVFVSCFLILKNSPSNFFLLSKIFLRFCNSLEEKSMSNWRCFNMLLFHWLH